MVVPEETRAAIEAGALDAMPAAVVAESSKATNQQSSK
jgi:hypothetical protein